MIWTTRNQFNFYFGFALATLVSIFGKVANAADLTFIGWVLAIIFIVGVYAGGVKLASYVNDKEHWNE